MMARDEVIEYEGGIFKPVFFMFEKIIKDINLAMIELDREIEFGVVNSYDFNAHASKKAENKYTINFRSGIIPMTLDIVSKNTDYFRTTYPELENIETPIALGCVYVWTQILSHELGHILRGHVDITATKSTNMIDDVSQMSMIEVPTESDISQDQVKMLMEFDADIFSAYFISKVITNTIINTKNDKEGLNEKNIISLALTTIFFFFNFLCETEGKSTKYPPAMVRSNAIQLHLVKHLSGKTSLTDDQLSDLMKDCLFDAYSFLVDKSNFKQDMDKDSLDYLYSIETNLLRYHPKFVEIISAGIIIEKFDSSTPA